MSDILTEVSGYFGHFAAWLAGTILLMGAVAFGLSLLLARRGWCNATPSGPRWFRATSVIGAVATGMVIGTLVGVPIAATNTGIELARDLGSRFLVRGVELAAKSLAFGGIDQDFDIGRLRAVVDRLETMQFVNDSGLKGRLANDAFDRVRHPFVACARSAIAQLPAGQRASLLDLVGEKWSTVEHDLAASSRASTLTKLGIAFLWFALTTGGYLLFCLLLRRLTRGVGAGVPSTRK